MNRSRTCLSGLAVALLVTAVSDAARAQAPATPSTPAATSALLPPDVNLDTRSRLPRPKPEELDDLGRQMLAAIRAGGDSAPRTIRVWSPRVAQYMTQGNQYLRYESGLDPRIREITILLAARAMDQPYEWNAHEKAAREAGLPQAVIDIINHERPVTGVADDKQAVLIELGRQVLTQHRVTAETYAKALAAFGRKTLVDIVALMGHYTATAILLNAFDQQLDAGDPPLLAPRAKR